MLKAGKVAGQRLALLLAVFLLFLLAICGLWDIQGPDETRYVQIGRELTEAPNIFALQLNGEPYNQKPPLFFWLQALALRLGGNEVNPLLARLPSILAAVASLFFTYLIGERRFGHRAGLLSAAVLGSSYQFINQATEARLDMLYTCLTTAAVCAWLTRPAESGRISFCRGLALWGGLSGAMFTKGPLAILILAAIIVAEAARSRSWRVLLDCRPIMGIVAVVTPMAAWLHGESLAFGADFVRTQVTGETVNRFLDGSHAGPFWYYIPRLFCGIMPPAALLLVPAAIMIRRGKLWRDGSLFPILVWVVVPFIVLSLAHGKRQPYLLPCVPAFSLLIGWYLDRVAYTSRIRAILPFSLMVISGSVAFVLAAAVMASIWQPAWLPYPVPAMDRHVAVVVLVLVVWMVLAALLLRHWRRHGTSMICSSAFCVFLICTGYVAFSSSIKEHKDSGRWFSEMLDRELAGRDLPRIVGGFSKGDSPEFHVYGHYRVVELHPAPETFETAGLPPILVGSKKDFQKLGSVAVTRGYKPLYEGLICDEEMAVYIRS